MKDQTLLFTKVDLKLPTLIKTERDSVSNSESDLDVYREMKDFWLPKTISINLWNIDQIEIAKPLTQTSRNDISSNRAVNYYKKSSRFEYYKTPSFHNLYNTKFTKSSKKNSMHSKMEYLNKSERNNGIKKWFS